MTTPDADQSSTPRFITVGIYAIVCGIVLVVGVAIASVVSIADALQQIAHHLGACR